MISSSFLNKKKTVQFNSLTFCSCVFSQLCADNPRQFSRCHVSICCHQLCMLSDKSTCHALLSKTWCSNENCRFFFVSRAGTATKCKLDKKMLGCKHPAKAKQKFTSTSNCQPVCLVGCSCKNVNKAVQNETVNATNLLLFHFFLQESNFKLSC